MRVNAWVALVLFVASVAFFVWWQFLHGGRSRRERKPEPPPAMAIPRGRVRSRR